MDQSPMRSNTSGVTVEYTDPFNVFQDVQPLLEDCLPLRNLHWKSPSRPLRSIDSLQVRLIPGRDQWPTSDATATSTQQRRHQIPGLRQTPYLKIYLLRCDDNETYKSSSRKLIREWIKEHTPSQSTSSINNQENHDAFEWLVVHVVYSDTPAASQPRSSSTASRARASAEKIGSSKWPGRGSSTVYEKIRADFNGSSKSSPDRVAQIRLPDGSCQPKTRNGREEEHEDLADKLKTLILASFDLRVSQYEEDIREKDSQRNLPGWNFCTFFILKEGLARGFENVGLFDDALVGYDELAIGLDVIIRDLADNPDSAPAGTFLRYSEDLQRDLLDWLNRGEPKTGESKRLSTILELSREDYPLNIDRKPYREMILANNVSVFDVRVYIFARQLELLLKAGNATSLLSKESVRSSRNLEREDLLTLAEICRRATEFIVLGARSLRRDLENGFYHQGDIQLTRRLEQIMDNMVRSWIFEVALQVLDQTRTLGLTIPASSLADDHRLTRPTNKGLIPQDNFSISEAPSLTRKISSFSSSPRPQGPMSPEILSPDYQDARGGSFHKSSSESHPLTPIASRTGTEDLASWRAEIYLQARHTLQDLARERKSKIDYTGVETLFGENGFKTVSLDGGESDNTFSMAGLTVHLQQAVKSEADLKMAYEQLTDQILRHFLAANRTRSSERVIADMAVLKFRADDFVSAASYFHQVAPFYGGTHWTMLEGIMMELYARCLKLLNRTEDYIQVLVKMLPKFVSETHYLSSSTYPSELLAEYVSDLFTISRDLQQPISTSLEDFFVDLEIEPRIWHRDGSDGFQLRFKLRSLLGNIMKLQKVRVRLIEQVDASPREIWMENTSHLSVGPDTSIVEVESKISVRGRYIVDRIEILSNNIHFRQNEISHELLPREFRESSALQASPTEKPLVIFNYHSSEGVQIKVRPPNHIHLSEWRTFEVEVQSGAYNDISRAQIFIRSGTAGLRIKLVDANAVKGDALMSDVPRPGSISICQLKTESSIILSVPYSLENDAPMLMFKIEMRYTTPNGEFVYITNASIPSTLPVSVNVQDMFRDQALFSRFTVVPASLVPLRVLSCRIDSSDDYEVIPSISEHMSMDIFPRQPASLLFKFVRKKQPRTSSIPLSLNLKFACLDEVCVTLIEDTFADALRQSEFREFSRLLIPQLLSAFRTTMTANDMETIGLLREIELSSYEMVGWDSVLIGIGNATLAPLKRWLRSWHERTTVIILPDIGENITWIRQITIPVDIPHVKVVHTADINIIQPDPYDRHSIYAVGRPIAAEIRIRHTLSWSGSIIPDELKDLEFSYEVHANPEVWLVAGKRRGNFHSTQNKWRSFPLMLLPQRPGHLLLPGLEVKAFQEQRKQVQSELDYRNHGESILVIPDLKSTTVSLDPGVPGPGGGSWLVESEKRAIETS